MNTQRELELKAIHSIYNKLYANSTPSVNFKTLVITAEVDEHGKKFIRNKAYKITRTKYDDIINTELDRGGFSNLSKMIIKQTIDEGCCPKIIETCK
jgi:hypothetical protein